MGFRLQNKGFKLIHIRWFIVCGQRSPVAGYDSAELLSTSLLEIDKGTSCICSELLAFDFYC